MKPAVQFVDSLLRQNLCFNSIIFEDDDIGVSNEIMNPKISQSNKNNNVIANF